MNLKEIETKAVAGSAPTREEALSILATSDDRLMDVVGAARRVRERHFGKFVKLNYLVNVKSGLCPEDCHYCSQSKVSDAPVEKYPLMAGDELISHVEKGLAAGATRACLVASGRGPNGAELASFCDSVEKLKEKHPDVEVCACLGLLKDGQADDLKRAGVYAYNHNVNTSESYYEKICGTHAYADRVDTIEKAKGSGLSSCSGVLAGMGESDADLVDMAFDLRNRRVESIPINFLISIPNTPLADTWRLTPHRCLLILAMFRFVNPAVEIRIAGGRELHLGTLQPLGLMIANSIFLGDYLTTKGQAARADLEMIRDLGYRVLGRPDNFLDEVLFRAEPELKDKRGEPAAR